MNSPGPLIPKAWGLEYARFQRRLRSKIVIVAVVVFHVVALSALLIQGCKRNHSTLETSDTGSTNLDQSVLTNYSSVNLLAETNRAILPPSPLTSATPVLTVTEPLTSPTGARREQPVGKGFIYTIRRGDTLSPIAKTHYTTVKAIKAVTGLKTDQLVVGRRLNLPELEQSSGHRVAKVIPDKSP